MRVNLPIANIKIMLKIGISSLRLIWALPLFFILSTTGYSVGFGNLNVNSKLGEALNLEVELLSVTPAELGTMEVSLASRSDFSRAGIRYPDDASTFIFEIVEGINNDYFVSITTDNPVNDTFLHILLSNLRALCS